MMKPCYKYNAEVVRVVDGDTIDVLLDFGFGLKQKMRLRLNGINTPELNSKNESERVRARKAKKFVERMLFYDRECWRPKPLIVETIKTRFGKERQTFGRYVADVYYNVETTSHNCLNEVLVAEGLAEESSG